jgi:predicted permease
LLVTLPAVWTAVRADLAATLRSHPVNRAGAGRLRTRLVTAQIAVSMVLVSSAAVLGRSFLETQRADPGFTREPVLTAWLSPVDLTPGQGEEAVEHLQALPGVARVALALRAPLSLSGGGMTRSIAVPSSGAAAPLRDVKFTAVSASYFETMEIRLLDGRFFTAEEERRGDPVAVVNETFASTMLAGRRPHERLLRAAQTSIDHRIVGIVGNAAIETIGEPPEPYVYLPYWSDRYGEVTFLVRTRGLPLPGLAAQMAETLKRVDPQLEPRRGVIAMAEYIEYRASTQEATAALATGLAAIGLFLTAIGVYGVIAYRTSRRAREIGVRVALGAQRSQVMRLVLRDGVRVGLLGLAIGVPAALAATRLLESLIFGVHPWDAPTLVMSALALCAAVGLATFVPAWRAARRAQSQALRESS